MPACVFEFHAFIVFVGETISAICSAISSTRSKNSRHICIWDEGVRHDYFQSILRKTQHILKIVLFTAKIEVSQSHFQFPRSPLETPGTIAIVTKSVACCFKLLSLSYLPTQIRFPIGEEHVTCRRSKCTNSLGRAKLPNSLGKQHLNFRLTRDQVLQTSANLWASRRKATDFFAVFSGFELGGITKHLMSGPSGNNKFT